MDKNMTWDLTQMYPDLDAWQANLKKAQDIAEQIAAMQGTITQNAQNLYQALTLNDKLGEIVSALFVYAKMYFDQNMADATAKNIYESADSAYTIIAEKLAFFEPELLNLTAESWQAYSSELPELKLYDFLIKNFLERKEHVFNTQIEEILSKMGSMANSFEKIYDDLTVNDITYKDISTPKGETICADNNNYAVALSNSDRDFRCEYFTSLLGIYKQHVHTIASAYYGSVKSDCFLAKSRRYPSARNMALSGLHIPEEVYDNLISTVRANSAPLQDYVTFRKEKLGLDDIHFYDLFVPLVKDTDRKYTFAEAKDLVLEATSVLGDDYTKVLEEAFNNRWIDVYPAPNKATGAYAIHAYGYHPYSLLNFTGTLNDVFTIAHELGHVMHSYYSNTNQPYVYADYCIFTAEVASTVNEQLMFDYLYAHSSSEAEKALLLTNQLDNIRSTLYRQTLFADFENITHQAVESGLPLLPEKMCADYAELYHIYHGDDFIVDDLLTYEWARIPHFYRAFYVYQYATGISAATAIAKGIIEHKENAVQNYRTFLTKGGSDYPIELLKIAGVDMASPKPIEDALSYFADVLGELKTLI